MEATNLAKPRESITTAVARKDMPAKVKTALRTLLLSASDVPGTEGRKTALRFNGHGELPAGLQFCKEVGDNCCT